MVNAQHFDALFLHTANRDVRQRWKQQLACTLLSPRTAMVRESVNERIESYRLRMVGVQRIRTYERSICSRRSSILLPQ